ncbi:MAG: MiaB/RimO family radical SAM methylthiotransferase [Candidatus Omnitrophota bacterium]
MISRITVGIISLGCPRNLVDSEVILGGLNKKKYRIVSDLKNADIAIVNTCSFIEDAKKESIDTILDLIDLKKKAKLKKIIVAGCLVQRYSAVLEKEFKEVDAFIGRISSSGYHNRFSLTPKHIGYLKIAEGCSNNCSYCCIPQIKGDLKSQKPKDVLSDVEYFDRRKISELNIIGQDISSYGLDLKNEINLAALLKLILKKSKNIKWFRLLYLHPRHIDNELISLIKTEPRICKYIDLPIQHINDRILKLMNRQITKKEINNLIDKLRNEIKNLTIRTSIIVGFPSETAAEFEELVNFVEMQKFQRLGAFIYSKEEGTQAYNFSGHIEDSIKRQRLDILMNKQKNISLKLNQSLIGQIKEVLIDEKIHSGYLARTQADAPEVDNQVIIDTKSLFNLGIFKKVKIIDAYEYDLAGELL